MQSRPAAETAPGAPAEGDADRQRGTSGVANTRCWAWAAHRPPEARCLVRGCAAGRAAAVAASNQEAWHHSPRSRWLPSPPAGCRPSCRQQPGGSTRTDPRQWQQPPAGRSERGSAKLHAAAEDSMRCWRASRVAYRCTAEGEEGEGGCTPAPPSCRRDRVRRR